MINFILGLFVGGVYYSIKFIDEVYDKTKRENKFI